MRIIALVILLLDFGCMADLGHHDSEIIRAAPPNPFSNTAIGMARMWELDVYLAAALGVCALACQTAVGTSRRRGSGAISRTGRGALIGALILGVGLPFGFELGRWASGDIQTLSPSRMDYEPRWMLGSIVGMACGAVVGLGLGAVALFQGRRIPSIIQPHPLD